jgi:hypothetical protein
MRVTLALGFETDPDADDLTYVPLDELAAEGLGDRPTGQDLGFELGTVELDAGGQTSRIADALRYAVIGLLRSVPALAAGDAYTYRPFDSGSEVQLVADGDTVLVSGTQVRPLACPRSGLLDQLVAAGARFAEVMPQLLPGYEDYLEVVRQELDAARNALVR